MTLACDPTFRCQILKYLWVLFVRLFVFQNFQTAVLTKMPEVCSANFSIRTNQKPHITFKNSQNTEKVLELASNYFGRITSPATAEWHIRLLPQKKKMFLTSLPTKTFLWKVGIARWCITLSRLMREYIALAIATFHDLTFAQNTTGQLWWWKKAVKRR